jgi:hypothetical protein
MLTPIGPLPPEDLRHHPTPHAWHQITAAALKLEPLLATTEPALYRLEDVHDALGAPPIHYQHLVRALAWHGHPTVDTPDGRVVTLNPTGRIRDHDLAVLARIKTLSRPTTIRDLHRGCRGHWVSAWALRGAVARLVASAELEAVPAPAGHLPNRWILAGAGSSGGDAL